MAGVLLGSTTKPANSLSLGAGKQFGFLLNIASAGKGVKELHTWIGASISATATHYGIFEGTAEKPEKLLATCERSSKAGKAEEALTLALSKEITVSAGKHYWLVALATGGTGSILVAKEAGAYVKGTAGSLAAIQEETAANWKVEAAEGPPGAYLEGEPSASVSPELKTGSQIEASIKLKKFAPELQTGSQLSGEAFSGGAPLYYGPAGEEAAEKKKWQEEEKEPTSTAGTGVRYLYAWKGQPKSEAHPLEKRRTVIFIHGGGDVNNQWRTLEGYGQGSGQYVQAFAPKGAEHSGKAGHGFCVFNLNYRDEPAVGPERQLEDVVEGIKFCIAHAEAYGGDPGKIYLLGGSAGVGLALRAAQIINAETPNAIAGVCGLSPYGFDYETIAKEMETGAYREYWRYPLTFKEKSTKILELAAHGLLTGAQIQFTSLPSEASLKKAVTYYVKVVSSSEIELEEKEGKGTISWGAFGAGEPVAVEKHPGGSVHNLIENLQTALAQELNYTGSGYTPAWEPPIKAAAEKTNTTKARALQHSLSPLNHSMPGQFRALFVKCSKDLIEEGWVKPTVERLEAEGHPTLYYIVTEGNGAEGHSFSSLWGVGKVKPGSPLLLGQEVLANWIEENIYTATIATGTQITGSSSRSFTGQINTGSRLTGNASRSFTAALKTGSQVTGSRSRSFAGQLNTGSQLISRVSRSRAPTLQTGTTLTGNASRSFAGTLKTGSQITAATSRSFTAQLRGGTQLTSSTSRSRAATLQTGSTLSGVASRSPAPILKTGTRLTANISRSFAGQLNTGSQLTVRLSNNFRPLLFTGTTLTGRAGRAYGTELRTGTRLIAIVNALSPTLHTGSTLTVILPVVIVYPGQVTPSSRAGELAGNA